MIDLESTHPDWKLAQIHAQATRAGKVKGNISSVQRCPCCLRPVQLTPISIFKNSKQLQVLGFAYPLFLNFLKQAIMLIFLQICTYNIIVLYNSIQYNQHECSDLAQDEYITTNCSIFFVQISSIISTVSSQQKIIRICSFAVQLFMLVLIRNNITKKLKYYDQRATRLSDYAVVIKGLPNVLGIRRKIYDLFEQYFSVPVKIEENLMIGNLETYYNLKYKKQKWLKSRKKTLTKKVIDQQKLRSINDYLVTLDEMIDTQVERMITLTKKDQLICEKVILVFQSSQVKEQVLNEFKQFRGSQEKQELLKNVLESFQTEHIRIDGAPEPEEIIWNHINVPRSRKRVRQILGWFFTILFMAAITALFYLAIKQKSLLVQHQVQTIHEQFQKGQTLDDHGLQAEIIALVYIAIFSVVLINKLVISKFLHLITDFEKHHTYSTQEYYFSVKYTITLFLTTAVMTLLVEGITLHNIYSYQFGVVQEQSIMFVVNALFIPFIWIVHPFQLVRLIRRKYNYGQEELTQRQANQLMMDQPAALGKHFSQTIQIIWFTFMYATIIPVGGIIILGGFIVNYWVVKWTILRRSSVAHQISGNFIMLALNLLDFSIIMKPAGQLIFDTSIRDGYQIESIICLIIGVIYILIPINLIINTLHKEQYLLQQKTYSMMKSEFVTNYQMMHPIYSLKKIFVQKELQRLNLYKTTDLVNDHQMKIGTGIDEALRRPTQNCKLKPTPINLELVRIESADSKAQESPYFRTPFL